MAAASEQATDGYAAGSEAEEQQAVTGPSERPPRQRAKRRTGGQRQRQAARKNREAVHEEVMWKTYGERMVCDARTDE